MAELVNRYAAALLDLSVESDKLEENIKAAEMLRDVLRDKDCRTFLEHPHIQDWEKHEFLEKLFAGRISADLMGFLRLAVAKSREAVIVPTLDAFIEMGKKHMGELTAWVVSAAPLSEEKINSIKNILAKKLDKQVEIRHRVDPALIGGLYIHVNGRLIDYSVKNRLKMMKEVLIKGGAE